MSSMLCNNTKIDMQNFILNVDWLTLSGSQHLALARERFLSPSQKEERKNQQRTAEELDIIEQMKAEGIALSAEGTVIVGNLILDVLDYGTRFYSVMINVYYGRELFGILLSYPRAKNMRANSFQMKIYNRWLYRPDVWQMLAYVCGTLGLVPQRISRLDLAADFNKFACGLHPIEFIRQFMSGELKKKGRSEGRVNFLQEYVTSKAAGVSRDTLHFNALTIGKRSSDACCYLYNKTLEMKEGQMKPWIVQAWKDAGLNIDEVWRLEISLTTKALRCLDKDTGDYVEFGVANLTDPDSSFTTLKLFHIYLQSLFFFFRPSGQRNVSREKMLPLFGDPIPFTRVVLRDCNPSDRAERVLVKKLHTMVDKYRGFSRDDQHEMRDFAKRLADSCGLGSWYSEKKTYWKDTKYKV